MSNKTKQKFEEVNPVSQARDRESCTRLNPKDHMCVDSAFTICRRRWGRVPIWQEPEDLLEAFDQYVAWANATPVNTYEPIKSGPMAGTLITVPRKHLITETEFCMFIGASPGYLYERRRQYLENYEEYGLEGSKAFADAIDNIKQAIADDMDRGASAQVYDPTYVRALRGHKTSLDYTSGGEKIKGGLTIQVSDPRSASRVQKLKEFKKDHKEPETDGKGG